MPTVVEVIAWPLEKLLDAATAYGIAGERAANAADSLHRSFDIDPTWHGNTRLAAESRVTAETTRIRRLERTLLDIAETTRAGHGRMSTARDRLRGQVETARASGFNIGDDGAVAHPDPRRRADADYLTERITTILHEADAADNALHAKIQYLTRQFDGSGDLVPLPDGDYAASSDAAAALLRLSPEEITRYWESLTTAQRDNLIEAAPGYIGNLNGVDFTDRARANRITIDQALSREIDQGRAHGEKAETLRSLLSPISLPDDPTRTVPRAIIGFRDVGNGQFIEMVGELTSESPGVAVLVPGTGTGLRSADTYRRRAANLAVASGAPVIVYADGDFPQQIIDTDLSPITGTAFDPSPARQTAPRLVDFAAALDSQLAASGLAPPTTIIGHSYGGSVVGTAEQLGLRADRVVYASSAGTGVADGPWHNADPEVRRYSMTPPGDPIHYSQLLGAPVHGGDPDTAPGVTRLDSGYYRDGSLVAGRDAHAGYLDDPESDALLNIAAVISGGSPGTYVDRGPDIAARQDASDLVGGWLSEKLRLAMP